VAEGVKASAMEPILRRKTRRGRISATEAGGLPPPEVTAALRLALARAARKAAGLSATALASVALHALEELPELLPAKALLTLLEGEGEALGLCALDAGLVDALVEMQLTGSLTPSEPQPRRPTDVDAALAQGFLEAALDLLAQEVGAAGLRPWGGPYRPGARLSDPRPLLQILEEGRYLVARLELELEQGLRQGQVLLCLPLAPAAAEAAGTEGAGAAWTGALQGAVWAAPVTLDAVLHRVPMALDRVRALRPGDVLEIPAGALERVRLDACPGARAAAPGIASLPGRLGQARGHRAVRLTLDPATPGLTLPQRPASATAAPAPGQKAVLPDLP
jgi:flagellar motor switch protein FliM